MGLFHSTWKKPSSNLYWRNRALTLPISATTALFRISHSSRRSLRGLWLLVWRSIMSEHNLCEGMQSAYKAGHSTETALVRVKNDILTCMDKNQCVLFVLLDLSAAFDTFNHSKLLKVLHHRIGLGGTALMWFESYLRERTQAVAIRDSTAPSVELQRGVPQGNVLGPILFTIYTLALGDIVRRHDLNGHFYADDMQLYVSFDIKDNPSHQVHRMEACIKDIKTWMAGNHLKLNDNKTEVITFRAPNVEMNMPIDVIQIGDYRIPLVQYVRDLGVVFDHHMTMHKDITKTCASCYFHLRNISSVRDSLTDEATIQLVHAFVSSRIDYCNSLLYGIPEYAIKKLQRVQNLAARVVTRLSNYSIITPTPKKLHWLPVKYRIIFKVVLLTFKALHGLASNYLRTLLQSYIPSRSLRSETGNLLIMPKTRRKFGCQSFAVAAPKLWNDLPVNIRTTTSIVSFRSSLKTHLFKLAYAWFVQYHHFTNCCFYLIYNYVQYIFIFYFYMNVHLFVFHSLYSATEQLLWLDFMALYK